MILQTLRQLFSSDSSSKNNEIDLSVATAVLLLEAATYDDEFVASEREEIAKILSKRFDLSESQVVELIETARGHRQDNADFFHYTRQIAEHNTPDQRFQFLVEVFRVVLADDVVTHEEDMFTRKLVNLLRLDRTTWIKARDEAQRLKTLEKSQ